MISREEDSFIVDLYELDSILVEVFYQKENEDLVSVMAYKTQEKLRALTKGVNLKPRLTLKKEPVHGAANGYFA